MQPDSPRLSLRIKEPFLFPSGFPETSSRERRRAIFVGSQEAAVVSLAEQPDEKWVARFQEGEAAAFDELFGRYRDFVFTLCLGLLDHEEDARDATQETFVRVYRSLGQFRGGSSFRTWLYRIAVNTARRYDQQRQRRQTFPLAVVPPSEPPPRWLEEWLTQKDWQERVRAVLQELPRSYRTALVLRYFQDLSYQEMAEVQQSSVAGVKAGLHRAREAFHARYEERFGTEEL